MRKLLLLRPEPGLAASAERARALGLEAILCPLFRVEAVAWEAPDASNFDALLLTSANAVRHGGDQLDKLYHLPVHAVGPATAAVARDAGFRVDTVGDGNVAQLLAQLPAAARLLHLTGEDHHDPHDPRIERRIGYRSAAIADPQLPPLEGLVVAVHSGRAGRRLAGLADERNATAIAAISPAAAEACDSGWEQIAVAEQPHDNSLLALAAELCHTPSPL